MELSTEWNLLCQEWSAPGCHLVTFSLLCLSGHTAVRAKRCRCRLPCWGKVSWSIWICRWRHSPGSYQTGLADHAQHLWTVCQQPLHELQHWYGSFKKQDKMFIFLQEQTWQSSQKSCAEWWPALLGVPTAKHLGNHLSSKINFSSYSPETRTDLLQKRAILFDKVHQIQQQFGYCNPRLIIKLLSIYSTALYGSNLWQINSDEHHKLNRSWNIAVKMIWDLPAPTHTCYLESLFPVPHLEAVLTGRYIGFIQNLACSGKSLLRLLFSSCSSDQNSLTGQNLQYLLLKYKKLTLSSLLADKQSIKSARVYPMTDDKSWKLKLMEEICLIRKGHLEIEFDSENLENILDYICTSWIAR